MKIVMDLITEYIDNIDIGYPIFISDIKKYVLSKIKDVNIHMIYEYINRYQKNNDNFIRYKKGIYYKCIDTYFGKTKIKQSALIKRLYLADEKNVYGYETGPSLINRMGLTTLVPKYTYYATNKTKVNKCINTIKLVKPVIKITKENFKYLQILDFIVNLYDVPFDIDNPNKIIKKVIDDNQLEIKNLLYYASFYKDKDIYKKITNLMKSG